MCKLHQKHNPLGKIKKKNDINMSLKFLRPTRLIFQMKFHKVVEIILKF